ncbi:MAG: hypothetical protein IBJ13_03060 [Sphingopyxis sp.]|nr:hypothetical protein [Sphingopyxis sp.]
MKAGWTGIMAALAACSSPASESAAAPKETPKVVTPAKPAEAAKASLVLAADGLLLNGALIRFDIPRADAERAVAAVQGQPAGQGSSDECSLGTIAFSTYKDDLQLTFQDGKFVGWTINSAASTLRTDKGIGIGSTRQELDAAYKIVVEEGSLGVMFETGNLSGLLDIDGIEGLVTDIWAGSVCLID